MMDKFKAVGNTIIATNTLDLQLGKQPAEGDSKIKVCVRVRPFIREETEGDRCGGVTECCIAMPSKTRVEMTDRNKEMRGFDYDRCYWSHDKNHPLYATQQTLQDELGLTLLSNAMNGFNNCIFAYGQTGSGKSYSVLGGGGDQRGLLPRVVDRLFEAIAAMPTETVCKTQVSFIEIYNEQILDLLAPDQLNPPKLEVRQHPVLGTFIPGMTDPAVSTAAAVMELIEYGTQNRKTSATAMNESSSRSHCIFKFTVQQVELNGEAKMSQTNLVDLAGSERAGRTKATGDRLKEGAAINQSLSTLARVISELAKNTKRANPPFRDSKLTYILKECLSGNSKTIMMAAISPSLTDYDETLSTMKFAQSVKNVQTKAVSNTHNSQGIEVQLRQELDDLKAQLLKLRLQAEEVGQANLDEQESQDNAVNVVHRATVAQLKYEEQMQVMAMFGGNWADMLVDSDKVRDSIKQKLLMTALSPGEVMALQEKFQRIQMIKLEMREANEAFLTGPIECLPLAFVQYQEDSHKTFKLLVRYTNAISITGPAANTADAGNYARHRRKKPTKSQVRQSQELQLRKDDIVAYRQLLNKLLGSDSKFVVLRPVITIDADDFSEISASVMIKFIVYVPASATNVAMKRSDSNLSNISDASEECDLGEVEDRNVANEMVLSSVEWFSGEELRKRLVRLNSLYAIVQKTKSGAFENGLLMTLLAEIQGRPAWLGQQQRQEMEELRKQIAATREQAADVRAKVAVAHAMTLEPTKAKMTPEERRKKIRDMGQHIRDSFDTAIHSVATLADAMNKPQIHLKHMTLPPPSPHRSNRSPSTTPRRH